MPLNSLVDMEVKMNKKPVLKMIDIEDIQVNPLNKFDIVNIEELTENIKEYGLLQPLEVYPLDNDEFILRGGERRYTALNILYEQGIIDSEIPCLVFPRPQKTVDERLQIILSNAQRDQKEDQKVKTTRELLDILKEAPEKKEKNMSTVEWLSGFLGCSPRTAQKYKNMAEGKSQSKDKKSSQSHNHHLNDLRVSLEKIYQCKVKVSDKSIQFKCQNTKELNDLLEQLGIQNKLDITNV